MNNLQFKPLLSTLDDYDAYLFDLWGVIVEGAELYSGVVDTINQISKSKKVFFVSNAPRPRFNSYERLKSWGLEVAQESVYTSGEIARQIILSSKERLGIDKPLIYHLGADRNSEILAELNLSTTNDLVSANILLLSLYRDEGDNLEEFDQLFETALEKNIICICANPDTIIPNLGIKRYCSGYFAAKYQQLGGKVIYTGKPGAEIFNQVLSTMPNMPKNRVLMIGDTLDTDILGANGAGIYSSLVMTGNARKFHENIENFDEKLRKISDVTLDAKIVPTFVTALAK